MASSAVDAAVTSSPQSPEEEEEVETTGDENDSIMSKGPVRRYTDPTAQDNERHLDTTERTVPENNDDFHTYLEERIPIPEDEASSNSW